MKAGCCAQALSKNIALCTAQLGIKNKKKPGRSLKKWCCFTSECNANQSGTV